MSVSTNGTTGKPPSAAAQQPDYAGEFVRGFITALKESSALIEGVTGPDTAEDTLRQLIGRAERFANAELTPQEFVALTVDMGPW
jgi:hypothetical protein